MYRFEKKIINDIGLERYQHSLRVVELSVKLAKKHGVDIKKAKIAAYFHDCAKFLDKSKILKKANDFDIINGILMEENMELIHGPLGAEISREVYGIDDIEILNAIKYHTVGRVNMTDLDKIIYLADYAEPNRKFNGVENVRLLMYDDLNKAMIKALDQTIIFLVDGKHLVNNSTIDCRNQLMIESINNMEG